MNRRMVSFFFLLTVFPLIIYAETYWGGVLPDIGDTKLRAEIALAGDIYTYSYTIISSPNNTGQIWSFDIDVKQPSGGVDLSGEGLENGPGYLKYTSAQVLSEPTTLKMVPVGLFSPSNWNSGPDILGRVGWGSDDVQYRILPGQSLNGFQVISRGLPGLRNFIIEPKLIPPSEESGLSPEESIATIQEVENKAAFTGKTIGPTAPPADFKPLDFLDRIISMKHEAFSLGWINDKGIENSLDVKLDNAKKAMERGNIVAAKNILNAFVNEVEAQGCKSHDGCPPGKHIAPEAYALLRYNAQYLMDKL